MFNPPTRSEKLTWTAFYGTITAGGILVLTLPPRTIEGPLGEALTLIWGIFLTVAIVPTVGSLIAPTATSPYGKYKWEYTTLPIIIAGVAIYAATVWWLAAETPTRSPQAAMITALAIGLARRWLDRRALVRKDKTRNQRADPHHAG